MKFSYHTLGWVAAVVLFAPLAQAQADLIPWMYNWSRSPTEIHADAPGTGYITLTDESNRYAVGDSNIVATNLKTYSTATIDNKDIFTAKSYSLTLQLTDVPSMTSSLLTFTGKIDGWLTAHSSYLRNTFTGATTQVVVLGTNRYSVTIDGYTPPGIPGSTNSGSISAKATVTVEAIVQQIPEPGSIVLASLGATLMSSLAWRRGRRRRTEQQREAE
ncbi:MAG: PEP-CTERM sorting domain-containing protein [Gemmataceae bacterium]